MRGADWRRRLRDWADGRLIDRQGLLGQNWFERDGSRTASGSDCTHGRIKNTLNSVTPYVVTASTGNACRASRYPGARCHGSAPCETGPGCSPGVTARALLWVTLGHTGTGEPEASVGRRQRNGFLSVEEKRRL